MATEEKKGDGEEKKEINKSSGLNRNVLLSIIVSSGWLIFLILWLAFYASNYTVYRNIAIILVCILIMGAILGISWASWAMKYCWNGENDKGKKPRGWWQLKRIWVGFCVIVLLIAFGIAQPILWKLLTDADPPGAAINLSTLLTIVVALFALGLTGFSVLIYEYLKERLTARITEEIKKEKEEAVDKVHKRLKEDLNEMRRTEGVARSRIEKDAEEAIRKHEGLSKKTEEESEIRQNVFRAQTLRSLGYTFWQLFLVWEEVKVKKRDLFSWDNVPGKDSNRLLRFLRDDRDIDWAGNAEITKSDDPKTIRISKDKNSAEIMIVEKKEKATLKISDGRTHDLKVKTENGKLNIYKKSTLDPHTKKIYEELIKLAIEKAKRSLDFAEELPMNKKYKEDIYKCRTNWMYFLAESVRVEGCEQKIMQAKKQALKFSDEILEEVGKVDYMEYYYEYQESCAWALRHLSEDEDKDSKERAHDIIHKLITDRYIRPSWREEIRLKWINYGYGTQQKPEFHEDFHKKIEGA